MSFFLELINSVNNSTKRATTAWQDFEFTVSNQNGETDFTIVGATLTTDKKIDCFVNDVPYREGAEKDWQRNVPSNKIVFNTPQIKNAVIRVRVYPFS